MEKHDGDSSSSNIGMDSKPESKDQDDEAARERGNFKSEGRPDGDVEDARGRARKRSKTSQGGPGGAEEGSPPSSSKIRTASEAATSNGKALVATLGSFSPTAASHSASTAQNQEHQQAASVASILPVSNSQNSTSTTFLLPPSINQLQQQLQPAFQQPNVPGAASLTEDRKQAARPRSSSNTGAPLKDQASLLHEQLQALLTQQQQQQQPSPMVPQQQQRSNGNATSLEEKLLQQLLTNARAPQEPTPQQKLQQLQHQSQPQANNVAGNSTLIGLQQALALLGQNQPQAAYAAPVPAEASSNLLSLLLQQQQQQLNAPVTAPQLQVPSQARLFQALFPQQQQQPGSSTQGTNSNVVLLSRLMSAGLHPLQLPTQQQQGLNSVNLLQQQQQPLSTSLPSQQSMASSNNNNLVAQLLGQLMLQLQQAGPPPAAQQQSSALQALLQQAAVHFSGPLSAAHSMSNNTEVERRVGQAVAYLPASFFFRPSPPEKFDMHLPSDSIFLSEYQAEIRKQLEYFTSTHDDVNYSVQGRKKKASLGQVGIRCTYFSSSCFDFFR